MFSLKRNPHQIIVAVIAVAVLAMGILLFLIPPALFPDPANGLQVLRSMHLGGGFNNMVAPDQSDISQDYTEYLTWWSPGQYLVPYFFKLVAAISMGQAIAITVSMCTAIGLTGFYQFFKKVGFSPMIAALSLVFIICQVAFFVPYVYYNGGEILLFAFEGWFLYGCASFNKPGIKVALFVLIAGWAGFFFKSSFVWIYIAGLCCLWIKLCAHHKGLLEWVKKGLWVGIPTVLSLACIYLFFLSKGPSPASTTKGLKLAAETFSFPLASPLLSAFSIDDFVHGLIYHFGPALLPPGWSVAILFLFSLMSLVLILMIIRRVTNNTYRLFLVLFYFTALLFFGFAYLHQLNISYEARHFRILGILIVPGMVWLVSRSGPVVKVFFVLICAGIAGFSVHYLYKGFYFNKNVSAHGITGIAQPNIDQESLNKIMQLDKENKHAVFVFIANDLGLEVVNNRIITLPAIRDNLKIDMDEYTYDGFAGPLFIVLPESYNGPKEKMIMKSFTGYRRFDISPLSNNYMLYEAREKR
ncbi:hypothetical protein [Mucilaginibacter sp.]|uniref:hypothetical protein n=1 Tax=Mucilaginibacter sp. TaxID=1882438 RepID=UPI00284003F0|nr:hypothetical protein [Mucilaginibacter sp.]MDR3695483.1 hypothetical protein [Mucilaginibacter sp.]